MPVANRDRTDEASRVIGRVSRLAKLAAGAVVIASLIYFVASYVRSMGHGSGTAARGASTSRSDYGEKGEPGSERGESGAGARR
jgi:hypothetical protein